MRDTDTRPPLWDAMVYRIMLLPARVIEDAKKIGGGELCFDQDEAEEASMLSMG